MLHLQHLSDSAEPPANQFDSGAAVAFNSAGSMDPNGGALNYQWDFGDGATSTLASPSHVYPSLGSPFTVTNRTVTLTVTNAAGFSASTTRLLAIRDVGTNQTLTFSTVADTYVDSAASLADSNFGTQNQMFYLSDTAAERGYVQFNLT